MSRTHHFLAIRTLGLFSSQLDHARPHHRQFFDVLHYLVSRSDLASTLRTDCQGDMDLLIHMVGNGPATTRMALRTPWLFRVIYPLLVFDSKRSRLTSGFGL